MSGFQAVLDQQQTYLLEMALQVLDRHLDSLSEDTALDMLWVEKVSPHGATLAVRYDHLAEGTILVESTVARKAVTP